MKSTTNNLPKFILNKYENLKKQVDANKYILELKNIDKIYDNGFQAIFGTNIKLKKGDFLALLGPSGCGKSTTLRLISGLEKPSQGQIIINKMDVTEAEPSSRDLTMVFQNYALFPHLTVKNNIVFGLKSNTKKLGKGGEIYKKINVLKSELANKKSLLADISNFDKNKQKVEKHQSYYQKQLKLYEEQVKLKNTKKIKKLKIELLKLESFIEFGNAKLTNTAKILNKKDLLDKQILQLKQQIKELDLKRQEVAKQDNVSEIINQKALEAAKLLELDYFLDRKPAQLSGGQRQRVALGRSIVNNPTLFLMDEPLSNLDAKLRATMRQEIRLLHEKINSGTVYVTHDQIEAMTMADKIAVMSDGFILQTGNPQDIFKNPSCLFVASFVGTPEMNLLEGKVINNYFVLKNNSNFKIELPKDKLVNVETNQELILGIRPTDFSVDLNFYEAYKQKINLKIITKELLGNEIQYQAIIVDTLNSFKQTKITFITSAYENYNLNSIIEVYPILSRIHLFDFKTTLALTSEYNLETILALNNWIKSKDKIQIRQELLEASKQKANKKSLFKITYEFIKNKITQKKEK